MTPAEAVVSFRITGRVPMRWNLQTGQAEGVSYQVRAGRTIIPLPFESWNAYFIVFGEKTPVASYVKPATKTSEVLTVGGPWTVRFGDGGAAPKSGSFASLTSWSENCEPDFKYFSGMASYQNTITMPAIAKNGEYELDLGAVKTWLK